MWKGYRGQIQFHLRKNEDIDNNYSYEKEDNEEDSSMSSNISPHSLGVVYWFLILEIREVFKKVL